MTAALPQVTPAERRRQRVRVAIIAAAEKVFSREGEAGLSIRRLAEEVDYSPSAIYKYFGSKEDLLTELKEAFFERLLARLDSAQLEALPFEARSIACLTSYIEVAIERPHHYAAAFSSVQRPDESKPIPGMNPEDFHASRKGQAFLVLVEMVTKGQASGYFDPTLDPLSCAKSVWASLHGLALLLVHLPSFIDMSPTPGGDARETFIRFHVQVILRGLRPVSTSDLKGSGASHAV